MRLDSARNAKVEIFRSAFDYAEEPRAFAESAVPLFVPREVLTESRTHVERDPRMEVAVGIAPPNEARGGRAEPEGYQIVLLAQDEAMMNSPLVEQAQRISKGEARVVYTGRVMAQSHWQPPRHRPLRPGVSIGHHGITAGTLGGFVETEDGLRILSNNHVLADVNRGSRGDDILQAGAYDGGARPADICGALADFQPIGFGAGAINFMDAALATIAGGTATDIAYPTSAAPSPIRGVKTAELEPEDEVFKVGRTTGLTRGRVFAVEVDQLIVNMGEPHAPLRARFDAQFQIYSDNGHFSRGGDSGSLIVDTEGNVAGLLFAGSDRGGPTGYGLTSANPIGPVLSRFGATIWTG